MLSPSVLLLLAVSALPTLAGLIAALWFGLDGDALQRVFTTPGIFQSLLLSVWSGVLATGISLLLAHSAVALAVSGHWRARLNGLTLPLLAMPHLAIGIGLALLLTPSGLLLRLFSPWASGYALPPDWLIVQDPAALSLVLGLVLKETCFLILALMAALTQVSATSLLQQGRTLGYGRMKSWMVGVAPLLQQQIRWPLAAVLVFGLSNVELAIPLGPGLPPTFSVVLWRWFIDPDPAIHAQAYAGTLILLLVCAATLLTASAARRLIRRVWHRLAVNGHRRAGDKALGFSLLTVLGLLWLLGTLAVIAIALRASAGAWRFPRVLPDGQWVQRVSEVLPTVGGVVGTTLTLAAATALVGVLIALPAAERCKDAAVLRRRIAAWLFVPLLAPQITFLFGVQVLLVRLNIDGTFAAVLWCHLLFALPYLWGLLAPARAAIEPRYASVAATLGCSPAAAWIKVTLPLLLRAILLALALAFSVSIALYLPTLFAGAGRITTAATEVAAAAGSGNLRIAAIHALLLAIAPLAAFALAYLVRASLFRQRQGMPQ